MITLTLMIDGPNGTVCVFKCLVNQARAVNPLAGSGSRPTGSPGSFRNDLKPGLFRSAFHLRRGGRKFTLTTPHLGDRMPEHYYSTRGVIP